MTFPAFKAGDAFLRGTSGGFDFHTLPPNLSRANQTYCQGTEAVEVGRREIQSAGAGNAEGETAKDTRSTLEVGEAIFSGYHINLHARTCRTDSIVLNPDPCYKSEMAKTIGQWLLFKCADGGVTTISKPFKTKKLAEKARLKYPEKERKTIAVGVIRIKL